MKVGKTQYTKPDFSFMNKDDLPATYTLPTTA